MTPKTLAAVLLLSLSASSLAGCAADASGAGASEQAVSASPDLAIKTELQAAIVGLSTGGGEGDPDPYKLTDLTLDPGESLTDDVLIAKLLPKLIPGDDESIGGVEPSPLATAWKQVTAEPRAEDYDTEEELEAAKQDAVKWRNVKAIFDAKLTNVRRLDMGYRAFPEGSLETGAVAHVFVGQTATGRVIAIWGIDIWT